MLAEYVDTGTFLTKAGYSPMGAGIITEALAQQYNGKVGMYTREWRNA
jgi:hypothetical protein